MSTSGNRDNQAIRFLEYQVYKMGNRDPAVHNFLLSLYVTERGNDETLVAFLRADVGMVCM